MPCIIVYLTLNGNVIYKINIMLYSKTEEENFWNFPHKAIVLYPLNSGTTTKVK